MSPRSWALRSASLLCRKEICVISRFHSGTWFQGHQQAVVMGEKDQTTRKMLHLMQNISVNMDLHTGTLVLSHSFGCHPIMVDGRSSSAVWCRHADPCRSSLLRFQVTLARCGEWAEIPVAASGRLASLLEKNGGKLGITSKTDLVKATLASCCKQRTLPDFSKYIVQSDNTLSAVVLQHNCTSVVKCLQRRAVIHRGL